jgi:hypothetical protein
MATSGTYTFTDDFRRAQEFTTTPGYNGWTIKDTSSAGTPTYLCVSGLGAVLTLAANSEAEVVTLYQNDVLPFTLNDIASIEWAASVSGIDAVTTLTMGLASAQNDTADSVATNAWFRMEGSASTSLLVVETDDATVDNNDIATLSSLTTTTRRMKVDFANGLDDIRFYVDGSRRSSGTTFSMEAAADPTYLQPFVQLQKASGTGVPSVTLRSVIVKYRYNY